MASTYLDVSLRLARHNEWADAALWRAIVPGGSLDGEVRRRMHHIHTVQHAFLRLWKEEPLELPDLEEFEKPLELAAWGREAHRRLQWFLAAADDALFERELEIPWAARFAEGIEGGAAPVEIGQSALQVAMHSVHHRGQVAARLREIGTEPPTIDFIVWLWRGEPAADWPPGT